MNPLLVLALLFCGASAVRDDEAEAARLLKEKGAKISETKGVVTALEIDDCSGWTEEEFRRVGQLSHLKTLTVGPGLGDAALPLLAGLGELESLQTNLSQITDDGVKGLAALKSLKVLKFFHPGKQFSGTGLAALSGMPALERLTVAGSLEFNDDGMAAVAKLTRLKEFRSWHAGQTLEGVKKLKALPHLQQLTLGQRLAYKPPTTLADETLAVLAEMKSLESLQLEEARLKKDALIRLKELPALKKLVLAGIDIAQADVESLRAELPKVEIQWTAPNEVYLKRIRALFGTP
jgi:hypothetical protein